MRLKPKEVFDYLTSLAVLAAAAAVVWQVFFAPAPAPSVGVERVPFSIPKTLQSLESAHVQGNAAAPVGVMVFSEFRCPYCAKLAADVMPALQKKYLPDGRVLFAFRHLPLEQVHPDAFYLAQAADCAGEQDKFWDAHDAFFANVKDSSLNASRIVSLLIPKGLNEQAWHACMARSTGEGVRRDMKLAQEIGIRGTPTVMVGLVQNGKLRVTAGTSGAKPVSEFEKLIDEALAKVK